MLINAPVLCPLAPPYTYKQKNDLSWIEFKYMGDVALGACIKAPPPTFFSTRAQFRLKFTAEISDLASKYTYILYLRLQQLTSTVRVP